MSCLSGPRTFPALGAQAPNDKPAREARVRARALFVAPQAAPLEGRSERAEQRPARPGGVNRAESARRSAGPHKCWERLQPSFRSGMSLRPRGMRGLRRPEPFSAIVLSPGAVLSSCSHPAAGPALPPSLPAPKGTHRKGKETEAQED